ncbi:MAG: NAD(P)H-hydrate dehydratase [Fretibacterium sp.]|nr:NAD(P)H-hydrate dehydratase [Fretibacterium sp.]
MPDFFVSDAAALLPTRREDMHKGDRGRLLVAGGSETYPGAPALSALAALRSGGGVVTLLSLESVCHACAAWLPEVVHLPVRGDWTAAALTLLSSVGALVLGPGLGRSKEASAFARAMWRLWTKPILVDGDGLYALSLPGEPLSARDDALLTPHEGEAARLLGTTSEVVRADRPGAAAALAERWGCVLLKGRGSLVACGGELRRLTVGGPELSVPGSGDVLSGCAGAFMAAGLTPFGAALLGGTLHALAGERLRKRSGLDGILASELADELPAVVTELRGGGGK